MRPTVSAALICLSQSCRSTSCVVDNLRADLAATFQDAEDGGLVLAASVSYLSQALHSVHVFIPPIAAV